MTKIRTTIEPTREIDVSDAELTDLRRRGVVLDGTRATTADGLQKAALRQLGLEDVDPPGPSPLIPPAPDAPAAPAAAAAPAPAPARPPRKAAPRKRASRSRTAAAAESAPSTDEGTTATSSPGERVIAPGITDNAPSGQNEES